MAGAAILKTVKHSLVNIFSLYLILTDNEIIGLVLSLKFIYARIRDLQLQVTYSRSLFAH